ncbi:MAG: hypothetical protein QM820_04360 [Minicystis sp.]
MEDLFRFVALRPPQSADVKAAVALSLDTPFQRALAAIRDAPAPIEDGDATTLTKADVMAGEARRFQEGIEPYGGRFVSDPSTLAFHANLVRLRREVLALSGQHNLADLIGRIARIFSIRDSELPALAAGEVLQDHAARIFDSIIALFLAPAAAPDLLAPLTELAQTIALVQQAAAHDPRLASLSAITASLAASVLLPPQIFPVYPDQILPVGVANLKVVKQQLKRYELGDVSTIENVLRGESRRRADKHTLTRDETQTDETEKTTETTTELTTADRFELKTESEKTLKEDLSVKAGVAISAKYGAVNIDAKTDVAYSTAKSESSKLAQTQARDVTQRAASKVTERVRRQLTTRVTETFEQTDERSLDNTRHATNVSGVYQFVNKVYEAQVFDYGMRLLFDFMIPEPAAFLRDAAAAQGKAAAPEPPPAFAVAPTDISEDPLSANYYGKLAATFEARDVPGPPVPTQLKEQSFAAVVNKQEDVYDFTQHLEMQVPTGYLATSARVWLAFVTNGEPQEPMGGNPAPQGLTVIIGGMPATVGNIKSDTNPHVLVFSEPAATVGIGMIGYGVRSYVVQVGLHCVREPSSFTAWQIQVHGALAAAHAQQVRSYEDRIAALAFQSRGAVALGGGNPEKNREIERNELKKSAIALLGHVDVLGFDAIQEEQEPPRFPRPDGPGAAEAQGRIIRFFEQAFEWDQMTYVFYPYFWGRKNTWYAKVQEDVDDPTFGQFLRAGEARVVVPVRPSFEADLRYFLLTGQVWGGGELPHVTDPTYLAITEEIKERTGAPGEEMPDGDSWEIRIPTNLIKLRADGKLPRWVRASAKGWDWRPATKADA